MTDSATRHLPTEINLHAKSRVLAICFADGQRFELPCEYLRVFSNAAEVLAAPTPVVGKETVGITSIEPQGQYGIRIYFDDGHDTGIYAWDTLYELGLHQEANWAGYLARLEQIGYQRREPTAGERHLQLLYFAWLAQKMRKESEAVTAPAAVVDVAGLLAWLARRKRGAEPLFAPGRLRVTVNKQFAEPFTRLDDGDEIALVPTSLTPPATPDLI